MPLTATMIRNAKPRKKAYRLYDVNGLYLEVSPRGGRWWRFKYRYDNKEKRISLGVYPHVGLKEARQRRDEARHQLRQGLNPSKLRTVSQLVGSSKDSFESVAIEWFEQRCPTWSESHAKRVWRRIEKDVLPVVGSARVSVLEPPDFLAIARKIESRGALETAHRVIQSCGQVLRYAVATGRTRRDVTQDLRGALAPVKHKHLATITDPKAVGQLLRAIDGYEGQPAVTVALKLAPLVFVRPGELRRAQWTEIDFEERLWRIPAEKMKMRKPHLVPLSRQAVELLKAHIQHRGGGRYVFPSVRTLDRPISSNTLNAALRRLGYSKEEMTAHGFRSMASTLLNEQGWSKDAIERQLAHTEGNSVRAAYNFAEYLDTRKDMMQAWADYLESLCENSATSLGDAHEHSYG